MSLLRHSLIFLYFFFHNIDFLCLSINLFIPYICFTLQAGLHISADLAYIYELVWVVFLPIVSSSLLMSNLHEQYFVIDYTTISILGFDVNCHFIVKIRNSG